MTRERAIELLRQEQFSLEMEYGTKENDERYEVYERYEAYERAIKDMDLISKALIVGFNGEKTVFQDNGRKYVISGAKDL